MNKKNLNKNTSREHSFSVELRIGLLAMGLVAILAIAGFSAASTATIEVTQPVQVTTNSYYERGQALVYNGTDYWMFYGKSDSVTDSYGTGNPDTSDYKIYYKKASTVSGLASATETLLNHADNTDIYLGEISATYYASRTNRTEYIFVYGAYDRDAAIGGQPCDLYAFVTTDFGTSWTSYNYTQYSVSAALPGGSAHHAATTFGGKLWVAFHEGTGWKAKSWGPSWSTKYDITTGSGTAKFYVVESELYFIRAQNNLISLHWYNSTSDAWEDVDSVAEPGAYDPTIYRSGGYYVCAYAPWDGTKQYLTAKVGTQLSTLLSGGATVNITWGSYDTNPWVDMWPTAFTDQGGDTYLFYTSERNPADPSSEIDGNIWYLEVDWDVTNDHYTYIQNAIDAASSTTVTVAPGTYDEVVIVDVNDLVLKAVPQGGAVIQPTSQGGWPNYGAINVRADGVTVDGFEVDGSAVTDRCGINVYGASDATISNNTVHNTDTGWNSIGIIVWDWSSAYTVDTALIENNEVYDTGRMGILCMDYDTSNNEWDLNEGHTIRGNTVHDVWQNGQGDHGGGIQINVGKDCAITDNVIYNISGSTHYNSSIYMFGSGSGNTITGNTMRDCASGITLWIDGAGGSTIDWEGDTATSPAVNYNNIYDNTQYGAVNINVSGYPAVIMDAEYNWWGDATGPYNPILRPDGLGDNVSDNVDYCPWLDAAAPGGNPVGPIENIDTGETFCSIQGAIDDSDTLDGHTIEVPTGIYNENVVVNKELTIRAASTPILDGGGTGVGFVIEAHNVTIQGFTIRDYEQGILCWQDSTGSNNYVTNPGRQNIHILNNSIYNINNGAWGFGIYLGTEGERYNPADPLGIYDPWLVSYGLLDYSGLLIQGNSINDTSGACIVPQSLRSATGGTLDILNNEIFDGDMSAIWIDGCYDLLIKNNLLHDCATGVFLSAYSDGYYEGAPNGTFDNKNITLTENDIYNNGNGISFYDGWPDYIATFYNNIYGNTNNGYNYYTLFTYGIDVEYNYWGHPSGPYHPGNNPYGQGDNISDSASIVDFNPWLDDLYPDDDYNYEDESPVENSYYEDISLGVSTVTGTTETDTEIIINSSVANSVTLLDYVDNPESGLPTGVKGVGKYVGVIVDNESAVLYPLEIRIYYTQADLDEQGITETSLVEGMYYWSETLTDWTLYNDTGVNTANQGGYEGYVWANAWNADQLSPKTIGADGVPPTIQFVSPTPDDGVMYADACVDINVTTSDNTTTSAFVNFGHSLVGYWPFFEGTGSTVEDNSTYTNDGTINGATWVAGRFGYGLDFNGTNYVEVPDNSSLQPGTSDWTVEAWIKTTTTDRGGIVRKNVVGTWQPVYDLEIGWSNPGEIRWLVSDGTNTGDITSTQTVNDGEWHHIVGVKSGTAIRIYIDGVLDTSGSAAGVGSIDPDDELYIGCMANGNPPPYIGFNGSIDEVKVWNRALGLAEIQASYNNTAYPLDVTICGLEHCNTYTYYAQVQDEAGNLNWTETRSLDVDLYPPEFTVEVGDPAYYDGSDWWATLGTPIWFNATDNKSGVYRIRPLIYVWNDTSSSWDLVFVSWLYDNGAEDLDPTVGNMSYLYYFTEECYHRFRMMQAWDNVGNIAYGNYLYYYVDNTKPVVTSVEAGTPISGSFVTTSTPFWINVTDPGDCAVGVDYVRVNYRFDSDNDGSHDSAANVIKVYDNDVNDQDPTVGNISALVNFPAECTHQWTVLTADHLGNLTGTTTWYVDPWYHVDDTAPVTGFEMGSPSVGSIVSESTPIYLNATDTGLTPWCTEGNYTIYYRTWYSIGGWTPWTSGGLNSDVALTLSGDCTHYVEYYTVDGLGNTESVHNETVFVDATAPVTTKEIGEPKYQAGYWVTTATPFWLNATDTGIHLSGVDYIHYELWWDSDNDDVVDTQVEDGDITGDMATFTFDEEGIHEIRWYAVDNVGNMETMHTQEHMVDDNPPVINIDIGTPQCPVNPPLEYCVTSGTPIWINVSDEQVPRGFTLYYNIQYLGVWYQYTAVNTSVMFTYSDFGWSDECDHILRVWAIDDLGNNNSVADILFHVDDTTPQISKTVGDPNCVVVPDVEYCVTTATPIDIDAEDLGCCNNLSVEYSLNGGANWIPITVPYTYYFPAEGDYTFDIRAYDCLGHIIYENESFHVDDTPPDITLTVGTPNVAGAGGSPDYWVTTATDLTISSSEMGSCPLLGWMTYYNINGGAWIPISVPYTFSFTEECTHDLGIMTVDCLGNTNYLYTMFYVDDTPPSIDSAVGDPKWPAPDGYYITSNTPIDFSTADDGCMGGVGVCSLQYRIWYNGFWTPWIETRATIYLPDECKHYVEIIASDCLGNQVEPDNLTLYVDNTAPLVDLVVGDPNVTEPTGGYHVTTQTPLTITGADEGICSSGDYWVNWEIYLDDLLIDSGTGAMNEDVVLYFTEECTHTLVYWVEDSLGHLSDIMEETFYVDETPPESWMILELDYHDNIITPYTEFGIFAEDIGCIPGGTGEWLIHFKVKGPSGGKFYWNSQYYDTDDTWHTLGWNSPIGFQIRDSSGFIKAGTYTISYYAEDSFGNTETVHMRSFFPDNGAPTTTLLFDGPLYHDTNDWITSSTTIILQSNDDGSGVKVIKYWIDDGPEKTYYGPFAVLGEGLHTIHYYGRDWVNQVEEVKTQTVLVDNVAPETMLSFQGDSYEDETTKWVTAETMLALDGSDSGCGIETIYYRTDGAAWQTYRGSFALVNAGDYVVEFYAEDKLGNSGAVQGLPVSVDTEAPQVTYESPKFSHLYIAGREIMMLPRTLGVDAVILGPTTIRASAVDEGVGIDRVELFIDGELRDVATEEYLEFVWNQRTFFKHKLEIVTYDVFGHRTSKEMSLWVFNL